MVNQVLTEAWYETKGNVYAPQINGYGDKDSDTEVLIETPPRSPNSKAEDFNEYLYFESELSDEHVNASRPKRRKRRKKKMSVLSRLHLQERDPSLIRQACGSDSINNLHRSARIPGRYVLPEELVKAINDMATGRHFKPNECISSELGSYVTTTVGTGLVYEEIKVHVRVLSYLINVARAERRYDGKYIRLAKCKKDGEWLRLSWLAS